MTGLRIAADLELPLDAVTETFAILAKRGSGKTYTAAVMAEEMLEAELPVCVIDPLGVWWGLRSSADGKSEGYPVVIFGGEHADVPLEETAGQLIADVIIDQRFPAVLDLSLLPGKQAMRRFMTAFLVRLQHRNRDPLHVIIDEADLFAPQSADSRRGPKGDGDGNSLLGAMEDLIRRGRARGIGATLITQRPAVIHKDVLSQAEVLIALRMTGTHDVGAIDAWVKLHDVDDQAATVKQSLPALPVGTAWVWSPGWLGILQKVAVRRRRTFDSSATPKMGERRIEPRKRADVDLESLGAQIAATVERAKADDPKELRRRITVLERDLSAAEARTPEPVEVHIEVPVLAEDIIDRLESTLADLRKHGEEVTGVASDMLEQLDRWKGEAHGRQDVPRTRPGSDGPRAMERSRPAERPHPPAERAARRPPVQRTAPTEGLSDPQQRILNVLGYFATTLGLPTLDKATVALHAGVSPKSGSFGQNLGVLRGAGYITYPSKGTIRLTDEGLAAADPTDAPTTTEELHASLLPRLSKPQQQILTTLIKAWPDDMDRTDLAAAVGVSAASGSYGQNLGALRALSLIDYPDRGRVTACDVLFLDHGR